MYGIDHMVIAEANYRADRVQKGWPVRPKRRRTDGRRRASNILGGPNEALR